MFPFQGGAFIIIVISQVLILHGHWNGYPNQRCWLFCLLLLSGLYSGVVAGWLTPFPCLSLLFIGQNFSPQVKAFARPSFCTLFFYLSNQRLGLESSPFRTTF
jgi:hypothetical protein